VWNIIGKQNHFIPTYLSPFIAALSAEPLRLRDKLRLKERFLGTFSGDLNSRNKIKRECCGWNISKGETNPERDSERDLERLSERDFDLDRERDNDRWSALRERERPLKKCAILM